MRRVDPNIWKNRPLHQRLAYASLQVLRKVCRLFLRFYHRLKYPPSKPLELRSSRQRFQSQSRLLMLPPEIRFVIWDHMMISGPIALYRARDRITYDVMPQAGPKKVTNITTHTIKEAYECWTNVQKGNMHTKMSLLPVLQTCQKIYLETLPLLYQANTFVALQNQASIDFCNFALPAHLSLINSLHIHFQFRERSFYPEMGEPTPYNEHSFALGPIMHYETYEKVSQRLKRVWVALKNLDFMAVRFPKLSLPLDDHDAAAFGQQRLDIYRSFTDAQVVGMCRHFHGLQPPIANGQNPWGAADSYIECDKGWRLGSMYMPGSNGSETIETRNYVFSTGAEEQWRCRVKSFNI